jgi:glycosyltransferase involved in cell wall biosynthesis
MIKGRDIIVMGIQAWDIEIGSNCKNIAAQMAKHNRVLYVNPPMDRVSRYRERHTEKIKKRIAVKKGLENDLVEIGDTMWNLYPKTMTESINLVKSKGLFDWLNRINAKRFTSDIKSAIERLGFTDYIIFNDSSMFLGQHIKTFLEPSFYVYYMRDYLTKNPYWRKNGVRLEPKLIQIADCVVNNSTLYTEYGKQFTPHSYMVGQGCDTSLFNDEVRDITIPKDLKGIPGPIIGYVGFLSSRRLSIEILVHVAKSKPDWSVVLVGPEDDKFNASELHEIDNVYFLGSRDASELPNYIKGFDVAINPQLINEATMGNYPRKIDEYLAMGKPTVASATKAMEYFKDYTYLGLTPEDYVELIEKALSENNAALEKKRKAFGLSHSWENNVNEIYNCILQVEKASA